MTSGPGRAPGFCLLSVSACCSPGPLGSSLHDPCARHAWPRHHPFSSTSLEVRQDTRICAESIASHLPLLRWGNGKTLHYGGRWLGQGSEVPLVLGDFASSPNTVFLDCCVCRLWVPALVESLKCNGILIYMYTVLGNKPLYRP